ncbi:MAG TPA: toll/interleukin-1 receptor domain-containing protein [Dehalococcoidales bacterium]
MAFSVFISHSVSDLNVVYQFKYWLEVNGIGVYVADNQPQLGVQLPVKVSNGINQSDCVIAILTQNGDRSAWVNQEIGYAKATGKLVIPVVEQGVNPKGFVAGVEYVTFQPFDPAKAINNVINYVSRLKATKEQQQQLQAGLFVLFGIIALAALSQNK